MIRINLSQIASTTFLAALLAASSVGAAARGAEPTLEQRLARLTQELEMQREELHIPGMAMAVVQGDELIYSQPCRPQERYAGDPGDPVRHRVFDEGVHGVSDRYAGRRRQDELGRPGDEVPALF